MCQSTTLFLVLKVYRVLLLRKYLPVEVIHVIASVLRYRFNVDFTQNQPLVESRRAQSAGPGSPATTRHKRFATWTLIEVLKYPPIPWLENSALLLWRKSGNALHFDRDPVEAVMGMPPEIACQVIAHVNQLFGDHYLKCLRLREIQAFKMHQNPMRSGDRMHRIGSADAVRHSPSKPIGENITLCCDPKRLTRQIQLLYILFRQSNNTFVTFHELQTRKLPRPADQRSVALA